MQNDDFINEFFNGDENEYLEFIMEFTDDYGQFDIVKYMREFLGITDRDEARLWLYVNTYPPKPGDMMYGLIEDDCIVFDTPNCGNWDCIKPDCQVLKFEANSAQ